METIRDMYDPQHEKTYLLLHAKYKGADQTIQPNSLISTFGSIHCIESSLAIRVQSKSSQIVASLCS